MANETKAEMQARHDAEMSRQLERVDKHILTARDACEALRKEQAEHEATRQRCERLEADRRQAENNVSLLRGFAMAKLTAADVDKLPPEFADFLRGIRYEYETVRPGFASFGRG